MIMLVVSQVHVWKVSFLTFWYLHHIHILNRDNQSHKKKTLGFFLFSSSINQISTWIVRKTCTVCYLLHWGEYYIVIYRGYYIAQLWVTSIPFCLRSVKHICHDLYRPDCDQRASVKYPVLLIRPDLQHISFEI